MRSYQIIHQPLVINSYFILSKCHSDQYPLNTLVNLDPFALHLLSTIYTIYRFQLIWIGCWYSLLAW